MINGLPTIYEVVTGTVKKQSKEKPTNSSSKSNKSGSKVNMNVLHHCCQFVKTISIYFSSFFGILVFCLTFSHHISLSLIQKPQRCLPRKMKKRVKEKMRMKKSMEILCVVHVGTTMPMMNSGFAVTFVRDGSMASVSGSLLLGLNTLSSTNALLVAIRGPEHDGTGRLVVVLEIGALEIHRGGTILDAAVNKTCVLES